mgnify:FL=1
MKIIRTLLLASVGTCVAPLLHAQDIQVKIAPKAALIAPPASTVTDKPSPEPELKPMNGAVAKETPVVVAEAPSPFTKDKNNTVKPAQPKPIEAAVITDVPVEKPAISPVPKPVVTKEQ